MTSTARQQSRTVDATATAATSVISSAVRTLELEREGLAALGGWLMTEIAKPFASAVETIRKSEGRVIVTGIGKSGHVGQKIAATLASTGTPASFVHPTEANHGDLGMITGKDVVLAISWSGETAELKGIINYALRFRVPLIALTCNGDSSLAKAAGIVLTLPKAKEACPHGLAPTTSTTMQIALGDALAIALLESRGFTALDFKVFHPGGSLGASLKHVGDLMHKGEELPLIDAEARMAEALVVMTQKSFGCLGVLDGKGKLAGMITDGDLRRHMSKDLLTRKVAEIMTRRPMVLKAEMLASQALEMLNSAKKTNVFVVEDGRPVGILHLHDLLRAGVA
ncbi:MAG: KpsF/GutQ family sugar-phosphate isomerase [Hyphomicrobiaceae bacterium]|nr:MAG: KpsF/GutQ family sugar-phosphate isomerase [Hyphomicrobiaceae bacterium]